MPTLPVDPRGGDPAGTRSYETQRLHTPEEVEGRAGARAGETSGETRDEWGLPARPSLPLYRPTPPVWGSALESSWLVRHDAATPRPWDVERGDVERGASPEPYEPFDRTLPPWEAGENDAPLTWASWGDKRPTPTPATRPLPPDEPPYAFPLPSYAHPLPSPPRPPLPPLHGARPAHSAPPVVTARTTSPRLPRPYDATHTGRAQYYYAQQQALLDARRRARRATRWLAVAAVALVTLALVTASFVLGLPGH